MQLGTWVLSCSMYKPPDSSQEHDSSKNDAIVVHCGRFDWEGVGKAEDSVKENDRDDGHSVDEIAPPAQP